MSKIEDIEVNFIPDTLLHLQELLSVVKQEC